MRKPLNDRSKFHTLAMLYIIHNTPVQVLNMQFDLVSSIILNNLVNDDQKTVFLSLELLRKFIITNSEFTSKNVDSIIKQLLNLLEIKYQMVISIN